MSSDTIDQRQQRAVSPTGEQGQPETCDIICMKDKSCHRHPGNVLFRKVILSFANKYNAPGMTKVEKMKLTKEIVKQLQHDNKSRFVRKNAVGEWEEISESQAREKVSHALKNAFRRMSKRRRSSSSATTACQPKRKSKPAAASASASTGGCRFRCRCRSLHTAQTLVGLLGASSDGVKLSPVDLPDAACSSTTTPRPADDDQRRASVISTDSSLDATTTSDRTLGSYSLDELLRAPIYDVPIGRNNAAPTTTTGVPSRVVRRASDDSSAAAAAIVRRASDASSAAAAAATISLFKATSLGIARALSEDDPSSSGCWPTVGDLASFLGGDDDDNDEDVWFEDAAAPPQTPATSCSAFRRESVETIDASWCAQARLACDMEANLAPFMETLESDFLSSPTAIAA